ncbi:type IV pilin protein [Crenothrix polyspora]|uniref:General secretion pathway protein H n=1 Tax=Crenothrix polyspora TaxID=360316 RepID=A0A1R4H7R6_9GAMM|nr:type IV pilin protein [Crenothrix polyspora]SJM92318.1 General secretion pathway protein H [Crenothrix polyspora]
MTQKQHGFTLIELMISVAIVGILASIAVPNYQNHIKKARREDAKAALLSFANAMERHYSETNSYCDAAIDTSTEANICGDNNKKDTGAPAIYSNKSPVDGNDRYYDLSIKEADITRYTLWAKPLNKEDECGTFILDHTGKRSLDPPLKSDDTTRADCW